MHSSPYPYPPLPPLSPPAAPPLPYVVISTLILVYVVLSYVIIDFIDRNEENNRTGLEGKNRSMIRLSLRDLQALPWFHYKADTGISCVICLESFRKGERCRCLPVCKHTFHVPCIDLWLLKKLSYPTCRSPFTVDSGFDEV